MLLYNPELSVYIGRDTLVYIVLLI